jgi:hypothetical protein
VEILTYVVSEFTSAWETLLLSETICRLENVQKSILKIKMEGLK